MSVWKEKLFWVFQGMMGYSPGRTFPVGRGDETFTVPLIDLMEKPGEVVERTIVTFFDQDISQAKLFERVRNQLDRNLKLASGIDPKNEGAGRIIPPTEAKGKSPLELVRSYLHATPFQDFLEYPLPFPSLFLPRPALNMPSFVPAQDGGKTQTLQRFIYDDIKNGKSVCVIDSQGRFNPEYFEAQG
jgi:hypothetical protein